MEMYGQIGSWIIEIDRPQQHVFGFNIEELLEEIKDLK